MLSHLLSIAGIESVVVDHRTRAEIENTVRAGILEADSVRLLVDTGRQRPGADRDGIAHAGHRPEVRRREPPDRLSGPGGRVGRGSTRRPTCSSTWPTPATATAATSGSASATPGWSTSPATARHHLHRRRRRGARDPVRLSRRRRRVPDHLPDADARDASGHTTSASTRSPGSASWPRRRTARQSSSTPTRRAASR